MPSITVPTPQEERILRDNGMEPSHFGVLYRDADTIRLLCYTTRDNITINRGDRKW